MPHDIIDNHTRELAPEINNFLSDGIRAHFAVGCFFLSGFQAIAQHIPALDQLRLLIGNVTNRQTIEQPAEGYHGHRELNTLRRSNITSQALVAQLLRIVRDYNLEAAYRAIADRAEEAPLIPRLICSQVLM